MNGRASGAPAPARPVVLVSGALVHRGLLRWLGWERRAIDRVQGIALAPDEVAVVEDARRRGPRGAPVAHPGGFRGAERAMDRRGGGRYGCIRNGWAVGPGAAPPGEEPPVDERDEAARTWADAAAVAARLADLLRGARAVAGDDPAAVTRLVAQRLRRRPGDRRLRDLVARFAATHDVPGALAAGGWAPDPTYPGGWRPPPTEPS